jgi:hypothetical protein
MKDISKTISTQKNNKNTEKIFSVGSINRRKTGSNYSAAREQ